MKSPLLLLVLLAASAAAPAATQVYSWTDANGVKHFSDSPPPAHVTATKIKVRGQLTTDTAPSEANPSNAAAGTGAAANPAAAKNSGPALAAAAGYAPEDIKRNCEIARQNLATIDKQAVPTDPSGNPLDPKQAENHNRQLDKANQQIKLFCGS
jgi:hypothetical protein